MLTNISSVRTSNSMMRGSCRFVAMNRLKALVCLTSADAVIFERHFVIFSQGIPYPILGAEDSPHVRMAGEHHARQVINFALVPIGGPPNAAHRGHLGQFA